MPHQISSIMTDQAAVNPTQEQQAPVNHDGVQENEAGPVRKPKGRKYAGQAFDLGVGANVTSGGPSAASPYPGQQPTAGQQLGGYPQQSLQSSSQQPAYVQPSYGQPSYGQPSHPEPGPTPQNFQQQAAYGQTAGYQSPGPSYPDQGGAGGMTQQFGQMGIHGNGQQQPQPQGHATAIPLNRLQTTDLISQPIDVSEIDAPPPPIVLPPNVSRLTSCDSSSC